MGQLEYTASSDEDREQQLQLLVHAFAVVPDHLVNSLAWAGHENLRVVKRGKDVLGCLTLVRMGQFFGGRSVPMVGIAGVAGRPDAARTGVATHLMKQTILELAEEGVALSTLYASTQTLYRKAGYETAGARYVATLVPQQIAMNSRELTLRPPQDADRPAVEAFYASQAVRVDGHLDRGRYIWNRILLPRMGLQTHGVLACDGDVIEGYVFYRKVGTSPPHQQIHIAGFKAATPRAYRRLWTFIGDLATSIVHEVIFSTAPNDVAYLIHPHPHFSLELELPWMLRIVDVHAALTARGYAREIDAELHLELSDPLVAKNAGRWVLRVRDGSATLERGGKGALALSEQGLAALYSGFATPHDLALLERVRGSPADLAAAAAVFAGPAPWMPDMF